MVTKPLEPNWQLDDFGFLEDTTPKFVGSAESSQGDGETETHERNDSEQSGPETVERIEDSTPEEWDLPENTEYTEYALRPTVWERRP